MFERLIYRLLLVGRNAAEVPALLLRDLRRRYGARAERARPD